MNIRSQHACMLARFFEHQGSGLIPINDLDDHPDYIRLCEFEYVYESILPRQYIRSKDTDREYRGNRAGLKIEEDLKL